MTDVCPPPGTRVRFRLPIVRGTGTIDGPPFLVGGMHVVRLVLVQVGSGRTKPSLNVPVKSLEPLAEEARP